MTTTFDQYKLQYLDHYLELFFLQGRRRSSGQDSWEGGSPQQQWGEEEEPLLPTSLPQSRRTSTASGQYRLSVGGKQQPRDFWSAVVENKGRISLDIKKNLFCLMCRFPFLPWVFLNTLLHNDPAAHQDHCGRCRIRTKDQFPKSLVRYQRATTSQMNILPLLFNIRTLKGPLQTVFFTSS